MNRIIVLGILLTFMVPVAAQESDETVRLDDVVVSATRNERTVLEAPGHATVITAEYIEASGAGNLADVLTREVGVIVRDYGAAGAQKSISIRGASSAQVLVLVDGIRQNDNRQGGVNLNNYSLENIERIEIVRGGYGAIYGADAVGGVINIITKSEAENSFKLSIENYSYIPRDAKKVTAYSTFPVESIETEDKDADWSSLIDTQILGASLSREIGFANVILSGTLINANNRFVWKDDELLNDEYRIRTDAEAIAGGADLSVSVPVSDGAVRISSGFFLNQVNTPGGVTFISLDDEQKDTNYSATVGYIADRFLTDDLTIDADVSYKQNELKFITSASEETHTLHNISADLLQEYYIGNKLSMIYGVSLMEDMVDSTSVGKEQRFSAGIFSSLVYYPITSIEIIPSLRLDYSEDFNSAITYRLSSNYFSSDNLSLKLSGGSSYRAPTFNDIYWPYQDFGFYGVYEGNKDIEPEKGYFGELGATYVSPKLEANAFAFFRYIVDEINWSEGGDGVTRPTNVGKTAYPGAEIEFVLRPAQKIEFSASYNFLYSFLLEDTGIEYDFQDDKRVTYTPVHSVDGSLEYVADTTTLGVHAEYSGDYYSDAANDTKEDGYFVVNFFGRQRVNELVSATFGIDNVFNAVYEKKDGYIAPPLTVRLGAELEM